MAFHDIRGQRAAIDTLKRALTSHKVPHAYLFAGPPGVGKHLAALALAMALNCKNADNDACGTCMSCKKINKNIHPDVITVTLPSTRKSIPIDTIRELESRLATRPHEGNAKVAIIDPADRMTEPAANALLKTLEEPPPRSSIILISSRASSMLSTVRSRCQRVGFRPLSKKLISELLIEKGVKHDAALLTAELCGGSLELADVYLDEGIDHQIEVIVSILSGISHPTPQAGLHAASQFSGKRPEALGMLDLFSVVLAELMWLSTHPEEGATRVLAQKLGDEFTALAETTPVSQVAHFVSAVHSTAQRIQVNNMNPQLALEGLILSMRRWPMT